MSVLLGLDPGSRRLGWGVISVEGSRLVHVAHGTLVLGDRAPLADRLVKISDGLAGILDAHRPSSAAVEQVFTARNARSALVLGHARGVALLELGRRAIPISEYAPAEVKLAVCGHGRASKEQLARMLERILATDLGRAGADATDALAIALCHAHGRHRAALLSKARRARD